MPYRAYSAYLKERFGERVHRVALDAGFGCPNREDGRGEGGCIYCSPSGSGTGAHDRGIGVEAQMEQGIAHLSRRGITKFIAYFQAFCGTGAPPAELRKIYRQATAFPGVVALAVGTRPDMVPDEVLETLAAFAGGKETGRPLDVWLELGLQSASDETLIRINRGHDVACFDRAAERAHAYGIAPATHVIMGLPGEDRTAMMATAKHLSRLPVKGVKLHHLYVEKGTELARDFEAGRVKILEMEEYIDLAVEFLRRLRNDVVIMRLAGQAPAGRLIAPKWIEGAGGLAQRIMEQMVQRGVRQGELCPEGS
jgi:radical SAM protein (TIGR01212 family)